MEQIEQWMEEEDAAAASLALRGRRHRNRNNSNGNTAATAAASGTMSTGSVSLNPADKTRSLSEEEAAAAAAEGEGEEGEKLNYAAANEEGSFEKSIYFGKDYSTGTAFVAEEIEEGRLEESVSLNKDKDTESTDGFSGMQYSSAGYSVLEPNPEDQELDVTEKNFEIQESLSTVIKHQYEENLNDENLSGFSLLPSERSCEDQKTSNRILNNGSIEKKDAILIKESDQGSIEKTDAMLIKESDQEVTELDVERVLEKQETHDLYCPNCNSCITRRVILRKRKRKIGNRQHKVKRDKFETKVDSELEADPAYSADGKAHDTIDVCLDVGLTPEVGDCNQVREPDIFRCLSCFSFFIPTGNGVKLFRIFGDRKENEDMQKSRQISATNTNWLFSIFASDKGKVAEQDDDERDASGVDIVNTGEPVKGSILKPQQGGLKFLVPSTSETLMVEESQTDQKYNIAIGNETRPNQTGHAATESEENGKDVVVSSKEGPRFIEKVTAVLGMRSVDAVEKNNTGSAAQEHLLEHIPPDYPVTQVAGRTLVNTMEPAEDSTLKPQLGALKIPVLTTAVASTLEKSKIDLSQRSDVELGNETVPDQNESGYTVMQVTGRTLVNTEEPAEDSTLKPQLGALMILVPTAAVSPMLEKSEINLSQRSDMELGNETETLPDQKGHASSIQGASLPDHSFFTGGLVNKVTTHSSKARKDIVVPSTQGFIHPGKLMTDVTKKSDDAVVENKTGDDDVILTVEEGVVQAAASQSVQRNIVSEETEILTRTQINEQNSAEAGEVQGWEILKSIVYGGLIESITSLGVVSSAAGADAATLNVLALGLANLFGGLFIIFHNLRELKNDHSGGTSNQMNQQVDQYQELLGQRRNFILHAMVAVSSFLIFGLLPPVIYGFSFRKSDNRDLKLVAVMAASLLCIIFLAIGKCYVQRPPKSYFKTVLYYVIMGVMASGASYIIGILIKKLLDKLGWFESSSAVAVPFFETGAAKPAWASY